VTDRPTIPHPSEVPVSRVETTEDTVTVDGREIVLVRPREMNDLLTEEAFERENLMPYWAQLWAGAPVLADVVAASVEPGTTVLELGCGLGLPSVAAARAGARVTATDWSPSALAAVAANARRNGVELETVVADWEYPDDLVSHGPWDLVIASDIVYEKAQIDTLLALLPRLGPAVLLSEPRRAVAEPFFARADEIWSRTVVAASTEPKVAVHRLVTR